MEYLEMKDRIAHVIRAKNLTAAEFALKLGIQPSNISHLLSGRNNPSLEFVKKLKETFPEYNLDWIVMGKGSITVSEPFVESAPIVKEKETVAAQSFSSDSFVGKLIEQPKPTELLQEQANLPNVPVLQKIIMVYSDRTFEELFPR